MAERDREYDALYFRHSRKIEAWWRRYWKRHGEWHTREHAKIATLWAARDAELAEYDAPRAKGSDGR